MSSHCANSPTMPLIITMGFSQKSGLARALTMMVMGSRMQLTRADVTAVTLFQATFLSPAKLIPDDPDFRKAVNVGEQRFTAIGCAACHLPALPLDKKGWIYIEPNPYNPAGNLQPGDSPAISVDLTGDDLPSPRLKPKNGVVWPGIH